MVQGIFGWCHYAHLSSFHSWSLHSSQVNYTAFGAQVDWYAGTCIECEVTSVANIDRQTTEQGKERD